MLWPFIVRAVLSGVLVALIALVSRRYPGFGGLIASLPLLSILGVIWLWRDTQDVGLVSAHLEATLWFVVPSMPMFLVIPALLRSGWSFWAAMFAGCVLTVLLYLGAMQVAERFGVRL